jgi:large-conductance mechanosensitive channel
VEKLINEIHGAAGVSPSRAEVMKPLATLEIGGMISSLLHILIVTPAIFLWLFERQLRKSIHDKDEQDRRSLDLSSTEASRS